VPDTLLGRERVEMVGRTIHPPSVPQSLFWGKGDFQIERTVLDLQIKN
jgi:hypothetical protein